MSQMTTGGARRVSSGTLDMYTGLALAGTAALIIALAILWLAGAELAAGENAQSAMPWELLSR